MSETVDHKQDRNKDEGAGGRSSRLPRALQKAWEEALAATSGVEEEVKRRFGRLIDRSGLQHGSEELQRLAVEVGQRLQRERDQLERRFEEAVRRAVTSVRDPLKEELASLRTRAERLGSRIEQQLGRRRPAAEAAEPAEQDAADASAGGEQDRGE